MGADAGASGAAGRAAGGSAGVGGKNTAGTVSTEDAGEGHSGTTSGGAAGAAGVSAPEGGAAGSSDAPTLAPGAILAAGHYNTCIIRSGGQVFCWGTRSQVLVCDPDCITEAPHPIEGLSGVTEVTVGIVHACALQGDGTLFCWGGNSHGEVGPFEKAGDLPPQRLDLGQPVRHVGAGVDFTCAVLIDGSTVCWGSTPTFSQRGGGSTDPEVVEHLGPVAFLSGAGEHACAILESRQVECWGLPRWGKLGMGEPVDGDLNSPVRVAGLSDVLFLDSQPNRNCILFGAGDPVCWGLNVERPPTVESGDVEQAIPTPLSLGAPVTRVSLGSFHGCGLRNDGHVLCWGANYAGQLGVGNADEHDGAVEVLGLDGVVEIAAGSDHTCALKSDESVWCWGDNTYQQFGTGSPEPYGLPSQVELRD
jgi:alpha-tubulin suppressor-like RCC1 family protein